MKKFQIFKLGAIIGTAFGALVGLAFSPKKGTDNRKDMADVYKRLEMQVERTKQEVINKIAELQEQGALEKTKKRRAVKKTLTKKSSAKK